MPNGGPSDSFTRSLLLSDTGAGPLAVTLTLWTKLLAGMGGVRVSQR